MWILFENQYEPPTKGPYGDVSTPNCDTIIHKLIVSYSSNLCKLNLNRLNFWIHWLPKANISTMSPVLVGCNVSSIDILLLFILCQCNVMTLLKKPSTVGPGLSDFILPFYTIPSIFTTFCFKLEQLEHLCSENTPPPPHSWLPIPLSHIGSQVKRRQSQSYKFKKFTKILNFWILKLALHTTHLLKLLDKMCKYEMDPMSIVEDTEPTRFYQQTDRGTDRQMDKVIPVYPPFNFVEAWGTKRRINFHISI